MTLEFPAFTHLEQLTGQVGGPLAAELRNTVQTLRNQLHDAQHEAERLALAQADAIVNSAMMMSELQTARADLEAGNTVIQTMNQALQTALTTAQENENRFRLLSDAAPVGIFQIDQADRCIYMNTGLRRLLKAPVTGQEADWRQWLAPTDQVTVLARWREAITQGKEFAHEFRILTTEGKLCWVLVHARPLQLNVNTWDGYIGTMTDITPHKEAEQLKDELVSTVSHELRTPLASLRGFTELMLERAFSPEKQREFIGIIHQEAIRLTNLINDFLDLQRIQSAKQRYDFTKVSLEPLLQEQLRFFSSEKSQHTFRISVDPALPLVHADADRLRQVLGNLLSNAIKFSPYGGGISLKASQEGEEIKVKVIDQGVGIPREIFPKLFRKFFRVENADTRKIGGTGLGLALVKEIIEAHGGYVGVESIVGQGSTFYFTLPVA